MTTDNRLVPDDGTAALATISDADLVVLRTTLNPDLTDAELRLFALVAARSGLDPFTRQIYAVKRKGRVTFQTSIDGYRSIAERTGEYDGQDEPEYGPECSCGEAPRGHPEWATVRVHRKGMSRPVGATAHWHEYKPAPGQSGEGDAMWRKFPRVMLAKVAEAQALRKAFPWNPARGQGIGNELYTAEEMAQAERAPAPTAGPTARERLAQRRLAAAAATSDAGATGAAAAADATSSEPHSASDGADPFLDAPATPALGPMTTAELSAWLKEHRIAGDYAGEVARQLWPEARTAADLSDEQRGALARELLGPDAGGSS